MTHPTIKRRKAKTPDASSYVINLSQLRQPIIPKIVTQVTDDMVCAALHVYEERGGDPRDVSFYSKFNIRNMRAALIAAARLSGSISIPAPKGK